MKGTLSNVTYTERSGESRSSFSWANPKTECACTILFPENTTISRISPGLPFYLRSKARNQKRRSASRIPCAHAPNFRVYLMMRSSPRLRRFNLWRLLWRGWTLQRRWGLRQSWVGRRMRMVKLRDVRVEFLVMAFSSFFPPTVVRVRRITTQFLHVEIYS